MTRPAPTRRILACAATVVSAGLLLTACGGHDTNSSASGATAKNAGGKTATVTISITDKDCAPSPAKVPAGAVKFKVSNKNSAKVTEAELQDHGKMLGEKENLTPGLSGDFTLNLDKGTYSVYCPGADTDRTAFSVTGATTKTWKDDPQLVAATQQYGTWIDGEVKQLVTTTDAFTAAVKAGNIDEAKSLYGKARIHYERIEPTAEIWGDLDARIDGRADDAATPADFTGFHRLEQALWQKKSLAGTAKLADQLDADVKTLNSQVPSVEYQPAVIANGATDLINEIQSSKITGEEERYSHIDLLDFDGNLAGANEAVSVLMPTLKQKDAALATEIDQRYQAVLTALKSYAAKPGYEGTGYVDYRKVTDAQRRTLAQTVDAYAESVSKIAGKIA
ncbi:iron uptake system protein EfeO [Actinacidiphila guanduensis]|uniref:Iron uptake system component EfeO n=1 Tax=Actinacidiphila guanduensis TaxID=310781 RepID=A0A1H0RTV5_9ACTN|nr:iron uptake system protein EfeO [Actinacidiphila guanduensis]SDP32825.1 iron uptake system component EfeO [Actinacidiphila guanduensis]